MIPLYFCQCGTTLASTSGQYLECCGPTPVKPPTMVDINDDEWTIDEMRAYAESMRDQHDAAKQDGNPYGRCEHCHYTRHPCDVFDLASMVLALTDKDKTT